MKKSPFRAVSIASKFGSACAAVATVEGVRYLCNDAPTLPLKACDRQKTCRCVYTHHEDRREDSRRDSDIGIADQTYLGVDRRSRPGRRATDRKETSKRYGSR